MVFFKIMIVGGCVAGGLLLKNILYQDKCKRKKAKQRTDEYLYRLYKNVSLSHSKTWKKDEVKDIKKAVRNMMEKILFEAYKGKLSKEEANGRLISVGSMEEETKVMDPDEFDFSFVMPKQDIEGYQLDECYTNEDFDFDTFSMKAGANIVCLQKDNQFKDKANVLGNFSVRIIESCESLIKKKYNVISGGTGKLTLLEGNYNTTFPEGKNKETPEYISQHTGAAITFEKRFIWTNHVTKKEFYVSVDLAPVIKPQQPLPEKACFLGRKVGYFVISFKNTLMLERWMYRIGGEAKTDCKNKLLNKAYVKTFVVDENKRVKEMWSKHRPWLVCYVLMKYFTKVENKYDIYKFQHTENGWRTYLPDVTIHVPERQTYFSSYIWKTMILRKVYEDKEHHDSVWECFNSLTEPLLAPNQIKISYLWDPFIEKIICLKYVNDKDEQKTPIPTQQVRILKEIKQILEKVSNDETITYADFKKKIKEVAPK